MMEDFKLRFWAFYDQHFAAAWYRASSIVVGWIVSLAMFLPNMLDFVGSNWAGLAGLVVPKWTPETQALVMGVYVSFIAPPLRAWSQKKIREATLKQAVKTGQITSNVGTGEVQVNVRPDLDKRDPV